MSRIHVLLSQLCCLILFSFVIAGCGTVHNYKAYEGETRKLEELAVIKGESRALDNYYGVESISVNIAAVDGAQTSWMFSRIPKSVLVKPGERFIDVRLKKGQTYAFGRLKLNAEMGKTYIVKTRIKNYSIIFWVEDEKTGEWAGGTPIGEPENKNKDNSPGN